LRRRHPGRLGNRLCLSREACQHSAGDRLGCGGADRVDPFYPRPVFSFLVGLGLDRDRNLAALGLSGERSEVVVKSEALAERVEAALVGFLGKPERAVNFALAGFEGEENARRVLLLGFADFGFLD